MKILLVIVFVILVPTSVFCLWVLANMAGMATRMEENMKKEEEKDNE